jgi:hypothetical protein
VGFLVRICWKSVWVTATERNLVHFYKKCQELQNRTADVTLCECGCDASRCIIPWGLHSRSVIITCRCIASSWQRTQTVHIYRAVLGSRTLHIWLSSETFFKLSLIICLPLILATEPILHTTSKSLLCKQCSDADFEAGCTWTLITLVH